MKLWQRWLCMACTLILIVGMVVPTLLICSAEQQTNPVTLSDGSQWIVKSDTAHNTLSTDGDGRYFMTTDTPNSNSSAFSLVSGAVYPLSTKFQLRCREAAGAQTHFGLTSAYSLDFDSDNSIDFLRLNGSPSENAVKLYVIVGGTSVCIKTTAANYTRNRVSTIGTVKQNGSWYMTWNNIVLDAEGCSEEVREYVKMENHFPLEALESGISLHFFASCTSMNTTDGFSFKADRVISDGIMAVAADTYADANNPTTQTKTTSPSATFIEETGKYRITMPSNATYASVMSPVTTIDSETGKSDVFYVEAFLENYSSTSQNWVQFSFSNDPTFSDGTEISFCAVKLTSEGGVHLGYYNNLGNFVTASGMNNNFFNDPQGAARSWQFKTDVNTGKIYLHIWGSNLTSAAASHKVSEDFASLADRPIYIRVYTQAVGTAKVKIHVTPDNGPEVAAAVAEVDALAMIVPNDLEEAEKIVAQYDASPYRYAVTDEGLSTALASKMFLYAKREEKLKAQIAALKSRIAALPTAEEMAEQYDDALKEEICNTYLDYIKLGDSRSKMDAEDIAKLQGLMDRLPELDPVFAEMKQTAENFDKSVADLAALGAIDVSNYPERNQAIAEFDAIYTQMNDYMRSFVSASTLVILSALKEELLPVQNAYEVTQLIENLPQATEVSLADENAIIAARKAYNRLSDPSLIPAIVAQHLTDCETQLEAVKLTELDWYSKESEITYTGNAAESYTFADSRDKVSGDIFTTTTAAYDMTANNLYWIGMGCGSGQFALLGLSAQVKGQRLNQTETDNIAFILRPSGSVLKVTFFDAKGEAENIANISGFDFFSSHCFGFEKGEDGHWYLVIDSNRCDHAFYTRFDQFMETYGHAAHVSLGGRNGFLANNVIIVDKNSAAYSGDWNYSLPFGCSHSGNFENTTLNLRAGTQAVYNKKIEEPQKYSIRIATGLQSIRSDTLVGLLTAPDAKGNYNCTTSNGLVLRFINRPTASDNRTHILMLLGGKWVTVGAYEPSFIDEDCYTLTVEKSTDGHYYFRIRWASGTTVVKLNRTNQFYRSVQLDTLVENGGYFMFATNSHQVSANIEMSYSPEGIVDEADEDTKAVTDFILFFEKNFDALNARSKKAYESVYAEWQKVSFLTRNSVIADLMDDDAAYNLLLTVIDYKDGDLDEYYTETEERMVSKEELDQLIAEHQKDDTADYLITYPDGTVIANIKNLSKNLSKKLSNVVSIIRLPKTEKHFNTNGLLVLILVVLCGGIGVIRLQKERADTKNDHRKG